MSFRKPLPDPAISRLMAGCSLDGLRAFEAAARLGSFTAAAEELCLTQSAISKQIKSLEDTLACVLFLRGSRALTLTDAGQTLYRGVHAMLIQLADTLTTLTVTARPLVSVTMPPSLASLWLAPQLAAFRDEAPDVDLRVDASEELVALERHGFDLAIRLVAPAATDLAAEREEPLLRETLQLIASPKLAGRIREARELADVPLLSFEHAVRRHAGMDWPHWYAHLGLPARPAQAQHRFSQYEAMLKAVADGLGVGIGRRPLIDPLIEQGRIALVLPHHALPGPVYRLLWAPSAVGKPHVQQFAQWLKRCPAELNRS